MNKIMTLVLLLLVFALGLSASRDELRLAVWYGIKNTQNDLDDVKMHLPR